MDIDRRGFVAVSVAAGFAANAMFLSGLEHRPEVLRFTFPRSSTKLEVDDPDYDPMDLATSGEIEVETQRRYSNVT